MRRFLFFACTDNSEEHEIPPCVAECTCYGLMVVIGGVILSSTLLDHHVLNKNAAYAVGFITIAVAAAGLCTARRYMQANGRLMPIARNAVLPMTDNMQAISPV